MYERSVISVRAGCLPRTAISSSLLRANRQTYRILVAMEYQLVKTAVPRSCASPNVHFYDADVTIS